MWKYVWNFQLVFFRFKCTCRNKFSYFYTSSWKYVQIFNFVWFLSKDADAYLNIFRYRRRICQRRNFIHRKSVVIPWSPISHKNLSVANRLRYNFVTWLISKSQIFFKKIDTSLTGIWTLGHRKAYFPPLIMSLWWFHVSSQSPERALEDSGVANDEEKTDNQNDAEKVQKILSSIFKKMIIYEACCLVNFTFCCSSASIWL